jgi:mRNA interferase HigB
VRIIKEKFLVETGRKYPKAASYLERWRAAVRSASWQNLAELHRAYPRTDLVKVQSGRRVLVFDVCHNDYRLIAAVHFNRQIIYTLRFMTHVEYSKDRWKSEL